MQEEKQLEYLWHVYNAMFEWVKFSDTKAGAILAIEGVIVGAAITRIDDLAAIADKGIIFVLLAFIAIVAIYISGALCLLSLLPRLRVGESSSIIFFAHVAKRSKNIKEYRQAVKTVFVDNEYVNQISDQAWALSKVAWRKYQLVAWAIRLFGVMLASTAMFLSLAQMIP